MVNNLVLEAPNIMVDGTNQSVYNGVASLTEATYYDAYDDRDELTIDVCYYTTHGVDECVYTLLMSTYLLWRICLWTGNEYPPLAVNYIRNGITSRFIFPFLGSGFIDGTDFYCISYFVSFAVPGLFTEDNMISY